MYGTSKTPYLGKSAAFAPRSSESTPLLALRATLPGEKVLMTNVTNYSSTAELSQKTRPTEHRVEVTSFASFAPPVVHLSNARTAKEESNSEQSSEVSYAITSNKTPDAFHTENGIFCSRQDTQAFCLDKKREAEKQDRLAASSGDEEVAMIWGSGAIHWQQAADALDRGEDDVFPLYQKAAFQAESEAKEKTEEHRALFEIADLNKQATLATQNGDKLMASFFKKAADAAFFKKESIKENDPKLTRVWSAVFREYTNVLKELHSGNDEKALEHSRNAELLKPKIPLI